MTATPKPDPGVSFTHEEGEVHIGGIDALVRLTLDQVRADARRGLKTGMFVSGYRGSPVGMLDAAFIKQQKTLLANNIHFVDGINEDLAATAVWGTQMLHTVGKQEVRRCHRHVVRQGAGRGPQRRRAEARQLHRHRQERRRARGRRRRPELQVSSLCSQSEPMLFHVGHAVAVSGQRAGDPRPRPARLHDVAPLRACGSA